MAEAKIKPKKPQTILDNRHLKIISAKKSELRDSVVFVSFDEEQYGQIDHSHLTKAVEEIDRIEPGGVYFVTTKGYDVSIYDQQSIKNKDIVVTINRDDRVLADMEDAFKKAFSLAKSVKVVNCKAESVH